MRVQYMFQVDDPDKAEAMSDECYQEVLAKSEYHVENLGLEQTGHGCGLGEWSHLGESWDFEITLDMTESDYLALKDEYGLYVEGEE